MSVLFIGHEAIVGTVLLPAIPKTSQISLISWITVHLQKPDKMHFITEILEANLKSAYV